MISGYAGGHQFKDGVCDCGRRLIDLRGLDPEKDVGKPNIAHSGNSNLAEITAINALIAKMDAQFETILGWAKTQKE